jgi:hypothetical protein
MHNQMVFVQDTYTRTPLCVVVIHSQSVLRQVHNLFQSEFCTDSNLVLLISSILYFPQGQPVAAYVFFLVFPSRISFPLSFL